MEGNVIASMNSERKNKPERKLHYIRSLRLILALGYVAFILGTLVFCALEQDFNIILFSTYGAAASIFAMALVGLKWVTSEPTTLSADREWQYQFLMIAGLLLIGTAFMFLGTILFALPYAIVVYLYLARLIRGPTIAI